MARSTQRLRKPTMKQLLERMLDEYENGRLSRRHLIQGLIGLGVGGGAASRALAAAPPTPLFRTHTINHVTLYASDVARSKDFYQRVTGLPIHDEGKDFCVFTADRGFLGLYAPDAGQRPGFDHLCFGIEQYDAKRVQALLADAVPESHPTIESGDQVYVRDPDGVVVQFADVNYKG